MEGEGKREALRKKKFAAPSFPPLSPQSWMTLWSKWRDTETRYQNSTRGPFILCPSTKKKKTEKKKGPPSFILPSTKSVGFFMSSTSLVQPFLFFSFQKAIIGARAVSFTHKPRPVFFLFSFSFYNPLLLFTFTNSSPWCWIVKILLIYLNFFLWTATKTYGTWLMRIYDVHGRFLNFFQIFVMGALAGVLVSFFLHVFFLSFFSFPAGRNSFF